MFPCVLTTAYSSLNMRSFITGATARWRGRYENYTGLLKSKNNTMTITICGSMNFLGEMRKVKAELESFGHIVYIPEPEEAGSKDNGGDYWGRYKMSLSEVKKKYNYIKKHKDLIDIADAILVINEDKNGIKHYVGANTFLEAGYAYYMNKKIYFKNPLPLQGYLTDELEAMDIVVLDGDFSKI